ncbi:MAG: DUF308 domain-containing protein [Firmicutes bacterium]|nr:DUF308 domain-containing protein [Bacillota bacterium]
MKKKVTVRPGRAGALVGGVVGIFFCILGFLVVIPQAGLFGLVWTGVAVFIAGSNLYNAFSEKGMATHTIEIEDDGRINYEPGQEGFSYDEPQDQPAYRVDPGSTVEERLNRLNDLYDKRLVTSREYEEKRKEILKDL